MELIIQVIRSRYALLAALMGILEVQDLTFEWMFRVDMPIVVMSLY